MKTKKGKISSSFLFFWKSISAEEKRPTELIALIWEPRSLLFPFQTWQGAFSFCHVLARCQKSISLALSINSAVLYLWCCVLLAFWRLSGRVCCSFVYVLFLASVFHSAKFKAHTNTSKLNLNRATALARTEANSATFVSKFEKKKDTKFEVWRLSRVGEFQVLRVFFSYDTHALKETIQRVFNVGNTSSSALNWIKIHQM